MCLSANMEVGHDNALLVGNGGWVGGEWDLRFRVKNNLPLGIPITTSWWFIPFQRNCMRFGQIWNGFVETTATSFEGTLKGERGASACRVRYELVFP